MDSETVRIRTSRIRLDHLLKFAGVTGTGGAAKLLVQAGRVRVNGERELRRGRALCDGDLVVLEDEDGEPLARLEVRSA
ncbi:MAG: hypothetical protein GF330_09055 [Candidatus Eisenbacteria bacterium]|nr:hypothetical protein [Candidatus Eisenbacteria bacterium]